MQIIRLMTSRSNPRFSCLLVFLLLVPLIWLPSSAIAQSGFEGNGRLSVMTYNVNEGSDFLQVQGVTTQTQFLLGVGRIVSQVQGTNPPERMQAVAREVLEAGPTLVSLQEVDQWYTGTFDPIAGTCGSMTLQYDMLRELLDALASQGGQYQVAAQAQQYAFPPTPGLVLPSTFICAAVNDYT